MMHTELKKLSEYVFRDHQAHIYNQHYYVLKSTCDHFNNVEKTLKMRKGIFFSFEKLDLKIFLSYHYLKD